MTVEASGQHSSELAGPPVSINELDQLERETRVIASLALLPYSMREVIVQRIYHNKSFEQIGHELDKSAGAVRVTWTRGIRKLRNIMIELD